VNLLGDGGDQRSKAIDQLLILPQVNNITDDFHPQDDEQCRFAGGTRAQEADRSGPQVRQPLPSFGQGLSGRRGGLFLMYDELERLHQ
jgi:hypothetical protein